MSLITATKVLRSIRHPSGVLVLSIADCRVRTKRQTLVTHLTSLCLLTALAAPALAQEQPKCEELIAGGKAAVNASLYDEGRTLYYRAYTDCKDPVALVHIAKSYQDESNYEDALKYAELFLAEVDDSHPLHLAITEAVVELKQKVAADKGTTVDSPSSAPVATAPGRGAALQSEVEKDDFVSAPVGRYVGPQPFLLLDRQTQLSTAGVDAGGLFLMDEIDATLLRLDFHLNHMFTPEVGLLASFPLTFAVVEGFDDSEAFTGIGNVDAGMFYVSRLKPNTDLIFRGSMGIPSTPDEDILVNILGASARVGDSILTAPVGSARASASAIHHAGPTLMVRGDFGLEVPLFIRGDGEVDRSPAFRISGGVSVGGPTKFVGEFVNLLLPDDNGTLTQLGVSVARPVGKGLFKGGVSIALGNGDGRDDSEFISLNISYVTGYENSSGSRRR